MGEDNSKLARFYAITVSVIKRFRKTILWIVGTPVSLDLLKEFFRGKMMDWLASHLGVVGLWLCHNPVSFLTIGVVTALVFIIAAVIHEEVKHSDSTIVDTNARPFNRQRRSKWAVGVVLVALLAIGLIIYSTKRYILISQSHNADIAAPAQQGAAKVTSPATEPLATSPTSTSSSEATPKSSPQRESQSAKQPSADTQPQKHGEININAPVNQTSSAPYSPNVIGNNNQINLGPPGFAPPPPRILSPEQVNKITDFAKLWPYKANIMAMEGEPDAWPLAKQIAGALENAKWTVFKSTFTLGKYNPDAPDPYGMAVEYKGEKLPDKQRIALLPHTGWGELGAGLLNAGLEEVTLSPTPNFEDGIVWVWIYKNPHWSNRPKQRQ
jgi:hypothetical protein